MKKKPSKGVSTIRIGNFRFTTEPDAVRVDDISNLASHRISSHTPKGQFIKMALENGSNEWLHSYAAVMFNVLCCVPDGEFLTDLNNSAISCVGRHSNLYGVKPNISKGEDDAIVKDQKELHEAMETLKEGAE